MFTEDEVSQFRQFMVTAINPPICIIGCFANIFNMIIFTRKHMRSSTNIYLTALAFADFFYLIFSLLELFNYYRFTHLHMPIFFYLFSTIVWLKEAFSYISICITVCFTIERYIAVRYPMHRQRYCTELIAKRIIIGMYIVCIVGTVSKSLEFKFQHKMKGYDATTDTYCDEILDCIKSNNLNNNNITIPSKIICIDNENNGTYELDKSQFENCKEIDYYKFLLTDLRNNETYMQCYSVVASIIFVLIPLTLLIVYNTLLILIVREASKIREKLTHGRLQKTESTVKKHAGEMLKISQENKITIVLISIVVVFLICQIPWAIYLILLNFTNIMEEQFSYFLAIIFNSLIDINSAVNLILYCGLSEDYRATSKKLLKELTSRASSSVKQQSLTTLVDTTTLHTTTSPQNSNTLA